MGTFIKQSDLKSKIPSILWIYLSVLLLFTGCEKEPETVTDIDGNEYPTVTIGTQVWMAENLKVTRLNDGTDIPLVTSNTAWAGLTTPGYCHYDNSWSNALLYGNLYNWYTVNTGKLCPTGWHVPTNEEWETLITYLRENTLVGSKLKHTSTIYWKSPNRGTTKKQDLVLGKGENIVLQDLSEKLKELHFFGVLQSRIKFVLEYSLVYNVK